VPRLKESLADYLIEHQMPGHESFLSVSGEGLDDLARRQGISPRQAMLACLDQGIWPERFRANHRTIGVKDQMRLLDSKVAVIGCGGLGGTVVLLLARLGVGALVVCDGDRFEESNLNRQMLATPQNLGQLKAEVAAAAALALNPAMEVEAYPVWATHANLPGIMDGCQAVVDCLDNMTSRYLLEEQAGQAGLPMVHGALAGLEGLVMTVRPGDPGLKALHGPEPAAKADSAEVVLGVPTPTPSMIATLEVNEVTKLLLGRPGLGPGQFLHVDLALPSIEVMSLS
jgi:molybdopterin-synthase adenylyltransferase